jgi:hypothetical protein
MKIVNMVKLKEEFDYESLCRKLETQVDHLTAEVERQNKLRNSELSLFHHIKTHKLDRTKAKRKT